MENTYTQLIEAIGENPQRPGLLDTPARAAKAMRFLTQGYRQNLENWSITHYSPPMLTK